MKKKISLDIFRYMLYVGVIPIMIVYILNTTLLDRYSLKVKRNELIKITKNLSESVEPIDISYLKVEKNIEIYYYDLENPHNYNIHGELRKFFGSIDWKSIELEETYQTIFDMGQGIKLIVTASKVAEDLFIVVTTPISPISEAIKVSRDFYFYSYLVAIALSLVIAYNFSKMVSRPIEELDVTTRNLSRLDFSKKLDIKTGNEIESLGESINIMSIKLEEAIGSLKKSNKKLQNDLIEEKKLEEMRKSFISSVNHELKTPLAIMKVYAEGLADGLAEEDEIEYYCQTITEEVGNMERIIKELLYFSEIDAGYKVITLEDFSIEELINRELSKFDMDIDEKNLEIIRDIKVEGVVGDIKLIERVVQNFLSNAMNYVPQDGKLWIDIEEIGGLARISIENSGEGIPEDKLDDIWKPFYKIEESRNRKYGGTGLGLSIVAKILDKHSSRYRAINTDRGVEFSFTLQEYKGEGNEV